jgi:hypothetical protein
MGKVRQLGSVHSPIAVVLLYIHYLGHLSWYVIALYPQYPDHQTNRNVILFVNFKVFDASKAILFWYNPFASYVWKDQKPTPLSFSRLDDVILLRGRRRRFRFELATKIENRIESKPSVSVSD